MMKLIRTTLLLASTFSVSAYADTCREIKNSIKTHCQILDNSCVSIGSCLTRRDTCVGRVPENIPTDPNACVGLNECMDAISDELPSTERCKYKWNDASADRGFCTVDRHWLYSEDGCPGKVGGVINSIAYGLGSEVDSGFTCAPTRKKYQIIEKSCLDAISEFEQSCAVEGRGELEEEDQEYVESFRPEPCEYNEKFDDYRQGDFELAAPSSVHGDSHFDGGRGGKKIAPHSDDNHPEEGSHTITN